MTTEARFLTGVAEQGIPAVWHEFGSRMSQTGALAAALARAVQEAHAHRTVETEESVHRLFDEHEANLAEARRLLAEQVDSYRKTRRWELLNAAIREADVDTLIETLRPHFGLHPYPVVLESTRFNIEYVQAHGFEAFYRMTDHYLAQIQHLTTAGRAAFDSDEPSDSFPPFWLYKLEMASTEVPAHCHVCQNVITYAEHAVGA